MALSEREMRRILMRIQSAEPEPRCASLSDADTTASSAASGKARPPATHTAARHVPAAASATGAPSSATTAVCSPDAVNSRSRCAEVATATWLPATASEHAASPAAAGLG